MSPSVLERLVSSPRIYNAVQNAAGIKVVARWLRAHFLRMAGERVLDVGAGTGIWADYVPAGARYVWTDVDPRKHEGFVARHPSRTALFASAADLPFRDGAMDTAIFISLAHHLTDPQLDQALDEVARVVRSRILFLDPVMDGASVFGRFLWACDRGSFPRTSGDLRARLERHFEPEQVATPRLYHRYLLFAGRRRGRH